MLKSGVGLCLGPLLTVCAEVGGVGLCQLRRSVLWALGDGLFHLCLHEHLHQSHWKPRADFLCCSAFSHDSVSFGFLF